MVQKYFKIVCLAAITILVMLSLQRVEHFQLNDGTLTEVDFHIPRTKTSGPSVIHDVPLVIYNSWHSNMLPPKMKENITSLVKNNPEFDYFLYSDDASRQYIRDNYPDEVLNAFDALKPGAYKSDLWRYCILYKEGGVYIDIKYNTLRPLLQIVSDSPYMFVKDKDWSESMFNCFYNGAMITPPNNPVLKECIDEIVNNTTLRIYNANSLDVTGPCLLGRIMKIHDKGIWSTTAFSYDRETVNGNIIDYIMVNGKRIMQSYPEYRAEQRIFQKTQHYGALWQHRDIYA
jgi:mannosyltransferase OCH1-like enzyme